MASNFEQQRLADLPVGPVLVVAPPGCGKTEALALRARAVAARGEVVSPRKSLAVTFSNKARDNLRGRMQAVLGWNWRQHVEVMNFHGLAARVIRAHGSVVGIPADAEMPMAAWLDATRRRLGVDFRNANAFDDALAHAKGGVFDDAEVLARLQRSGNSQAVAYQEQLHEHNRLDYDDLIRHGTRLLSVPAIARLYQARFGLVLVDEVQDLTLMQYDMVTALGSNRITFAGDLAQGIYSFAGADPVGVFARIEALSPEVVEFNQSYRSGPAVLGAVNALAAHMDSTQLVCAEPTKWTSDEGRVVMVESENSEVEAQKLIKWIHTILDRDPACTIGVITRRGSRADQLAAGASAAGISFENWAMPTHVPVVVETLKAVYPQARRVAGADVERLDRLGLLARESVDEGDASTLDELDGALTYLRDQLDNGVTLANALGGCRPSPMPDAPVAPGLHLLTAHKGKGQEFDWVVILGLEDGHVPDFRSSTLEEHEEELRVLHVMASRARYGLVATFSGNTWTRNGWRRASASRWLDLLRPVATDALQL